MPKGPTPFTVVTAPSGDITICLGKQCVTVRCAGSTGGSGSGTPEPSGAPKKKTNPPHAIDVHLLADESLLMDYIDATPDDDPVIIGVPPNDTVQLDDLSDALEKADAAGREVALWVMSDE